MSLSEKEQQFWDKFSAESDLPDDPNVEASWAGSADIANELLQLYLDGKKTAGSGLVKDYESCGEPLPQVGNFWIVLDRDEIPRCILRTTRVELHRFDEVSEEIAIAEGEGDCTLEYWRSGHAAFFEPYLEDLQISDLNSAMVVTEFFELVYRG